MRYLPPCITAGVTFERSICLEKYRASEGWTLSVALRGPSTINLTGTADGDQHDLNAPASTTSGWKPGRYSYTMRVTKAGDVFEVESGSVVIEPDISAVTDGTDTRSHARRTLEAIEAVIEGRASLDQERYRINNRELYRTPIEQLLKFRDVYRAEVQREEAAASGASVFRQVRVVL